MTERVQFTTDDLPTLCRMGQFVAEQAASRWFFGIETGERFTRFIRALTEGIEQHGGVPDPAGLIKSGEVLLLLRARGIPLSPSRWLWLVREGRAPAPALRTPGIFLWRRSDIEQWEKPPPKPRKPSDTSATPRQLAAATRMGIDSAEYLRRRDAGERWCADCRNWHHHSVFALDPKRADGYAGRCLPRLTRESNLSESANA